MDAKEHSNSSEGWPSREMSGEPSWSALIACLDGVSSSRWDEHVKTLDGTDQRSGIKDQSVRRRWVILRKLKGSF